VVNVVYEADEACALEMIRQNKNENFHILPYCLGASNGPGTLYITRNPYASSNLRPSPEYTNYYCEVKLSGELDGVSVQDAQYDAVYGEEYRVVEERPVTIHALDTLIKERRIPPDLEPDFLSLDAQGSELDILKGAEHVFATRCVALATEIEFHAMYEGQALFSDVFDFVLGHGFHFAGFTSLQEISPNRLPLGARAKGFLAFGDALFLRRADSIKSAASSPDELYLMLLKLAFVALNFGHLEYALQVLQFAEQTGSGPEIQQRLIARPCFRLLHDLHRAANELPPNLLHSERGALVAELRGRRRQTDWLDSAASRVYRRARKLYVRAIERSETIARAHARLKSVALKNPNLPAARLYRRLRDGPGIESPMAAVEATLALHGYGWLADEVRRRRVAAEPYLPLVDVNTR